MKLSNLTRVLSVGLVAGSALPALAAPMTYPDCAKNVRIKSVPNSAGVFLDESCKVAYVLPPAKGTMQLGEIAPSGNLAHCELVDDMMASQREIGGRIRRLLNAQAKNDSGRSSGPPTAGPFGRSESAPKTDPALDAAKIAEVKELKELIKELRETESEYGKLPGASATMIYELSTDELVEKYQKANSGITFKPLVPTVSYLSFRSVDKENMLENGDVLRFNIDGLGTVPLSAEEANHGAGPVLNPHDGTTQDKSRVFGAALKGQVVLSLVGACRLVDKSGKLKSKYSDSELAAHMSGSVNYSYQLLATRKYKAQHNIATLVKQMRSSTSRGGLFSTKTVNSFLSEKEATDWFKLDYLADDARFPRAEAVKEIKADILDRAVKLIGYTKVGAEAAAPDVAAPRPLGATTVANGLRSGCAHIYCQTGALVLDGLASIFGSQSSEANFTSSYDQWVIDEVSEKQMFNYLGSSTFKTIQK